MSQEAGEQESDETFSEDYEEDDAAIIATRDSYVEEDRKTQLLHPKEANPHVTKFLVMTSALPPREKLDQCQEEIAELAKHAINPDMMVVTTAKIADVIKNSLSLYHWCFYDAMVVLDNKLENDGLGVLIEEQTLNFSRAMKALWILSISLDQATGGHRYFDFLRARYIKIAKEHFARDVMIFAPPFGRGKMLLDEDMNKPAGEADVDL